jgi:hypothetical protein
LILNSSWTKFKEVHKKKKYWKQVLRVLWGNAGYIKDWVALDVHIGTYHSDKGYCEFCGEKLNKSIDIKKHMQTHA